MRLILMLALAAYAVLQNQGNGQSHHGGHHNGAAASPYAAFEQPQIKALSDQQIADLRAGRGMGLALTAELNGYPGPLHVLELADALDLTEEQRNLTNALIDAMRSETIMIGERVIRHEATLDSAFAHRTITPGMLLDSVRSAATAQGELRAAHLRYHLTMSELLQPDQIARYMSLRGYGPRPSNP